LNNALEARCHAAVDRFVSQRDTASAFLARFEELLGCAESQDIDIVLRSIQKLCLAYTAALEPGAGCRVSEEQFRVEVQSLTARRACLGPSGVRSTH